MVDITPVVMVHYRRHGTSRLELEHCWQAWLSSNDVSKAWVEGPAGDLRRDPAASGSPCSCKKTNSANNPTGLETVFPSGASGWEHSPVEALAAALGDPDLSNHWSWHLTPGNRVINAHCFQLLGSSSFVPLAERTNARCLHTCCKAWES